MSTNKWVDYYELLEIPRTASDDEIKKAYRKKAKLYHTDSATADEDKIRQINEANEVFSRKDRKDKYDKEWDDYYKAQNTSIARQGDVGLAVSTDMVDHYKALNLKRETATPDMIQAAYYKLLADYQNGVFGQNSELGIQLITFAEAAYAVLGDQKAKDAYDKQYDKKHNIAPGSILPAVRQAASPTPARQNETGIAPRPTIKHTNATTARQAETLLASLNKGQVAKKGSETVTKKAATTVVRKEPSEVARREPTAVAQNQNRPQGMTVKRQSPTNVQVTKPVDQSVAPTTVFTVPDNVYIPKNQKGLLVCINAMLLMPEKCGLQKPTHYSNNFIGIKKGYVIIFDDYTVQFATEQDGYGGGIVFGYDVFRLVTMIGQSPITEWYESQYTYWRNTLPMIIRGQKAIVFPINRIVPDNMITPYGNIRKEDLLFVQDAVKRAVLSRLDLVDVYFEDGKTHGSIR